MHNEFDTDTVLTHYLKCYEETGTGLLVVPAGVYPKDFHEYFTEEDDFYDEVMYKGTLLSVYDMFPYTSEHVERAVNAVTENLTQAAYLSYDSNSAYVHGNKDYFNVYRDKTEIIICVSDTFICSSSVPTSEKVRA